MSDNEIEDLMVTKIVKVNSLSKLDVSFNNLGPRGVAEIAKLTSLKYFIMNRNFWERGKK